MTTVRFGKKSVVLSNVVVEGNTARIVKPGDSGGVAVQEPPVDIGPKYRSKTEASYAQHLDFLKSVGEIAGWKYEPWAYILPGKRNRLKPDFIVWTHDGKASIREVKGWSKNLREGMTKLKTAAGLHPWLPHYIVRHEEGAWTHTLAPAA